MSMVSDWWYRLSMRLKLSLLIQVGLLIVLMFTQRWLMASFEANQPYLAESAYRAGLADSQAQPQPHGPALP